MSHQVKIDYEGISIQCQSICDVASSQLCKLDKMIERIEKNSSKLLNEHTEALKEELLAVKEKIKRQIEVVVQSAKYKANMGTVIVDSDFMGKHKNSHSVIDEANELKHMVNELTTIRVMEMEGLLNKLLGEKVEEHQQQLRDIASGIVRVDEKVLKFLELIDDTVLRQYVYIAWIKNRDKSNEELLQLGKKEMNLATSDAFEQNRTTELDSIRDEMKKAKLSEDTINSIMKLAKGTAKEQVEVVREKATDEIVGEKVRKETLRVIIRTIEKQGFIVNKKNIKINPITNEVITIAQKASGEKAEFRIFLDGKFIYRFDGYEGQACQKDIEPFMADLKEIYGIKAVKKEEMWKNPDKISSMKYQSINTNKNKG